jgi:hypothetical protein
MARLERRLRKLEARLTDRSRLVPHKQQWLDYWTVRLGKLIVGEELEEKLPLEFLDVLIASSDEQAGLMHATD